MASPFISRSKPHHTLYHAVILGYYQFQVPRFKFYCSGFISFNNRHMYIVYRLFLENEGEIMRQLPKVQRMLKVLYLVEQMPQVYEENIVPVHGYIM
eukprot:176516_1